MFKKNILVKIMNVCLRAGYNATLSLALSSVGWQSDEIRKRKRVEERNVADTAHAEKMNMLRRVFYLFAEHL
jgi:hypothetical protein